MIARRDGEKEISASAITQSRNIGTIALDTIHGIGHHPLILPAHPASLGALQGFLSCYCAEKVIYVWNLNITQL